MRAIQAFVALAATLVTLSAARAAEPFKLYDNFSDKPLSPAHWIEGERARFIKGGKLHLMQRTWSLNFSDSGLIGTNWNANLTHAATVTQMRARVVVTDLETSTCPSNSGAVSDVRTRLIGAFFNVSTPVPGNQVGDVIGQIRIVRASNSGDPAGILRVQGALAICTTADCAFTTIIGDVDLGTVAMGTPTTLQMEWDKPSRTFYFSRDNGARAGAVAYSHLYADSTPPSVLLRQLGTRVNVPNCKTAAPVNGFVEARFDNVFVNQTALP
jgi:hypothetical protein